MIIKIVKIETYNGKIVYGVRFNQGVQYFTLDYRASKKECEWMRKMLRRAFSNYKKSK